MSAPTLVRRELANAKICFIPLGETIGSVTVALGTWPSLTPSSNYDTYQMPDIEKVVYDKKVSPEAFMIPDVVHGGYFDDDEEMVTSRGWTFTTAKTNNFIKQLDHGLANSTVTTAQETGAVKDNFIMGVALITEMNKNGNILSTKQVWAKMRVKTSGDTSPATKKIEVTLKQYYSSNNTYQATA